MKKLSSIARQGHFGSQSNAAKISHPCRTKRKGRNMFMHSHCAKLSCECACHRNQPMFPPDHVGEAA